MTTMQRTDRVVWAEIPVSDMARAKAFYASLLGAPLVDEDAGPNPLAMLPRSGEDEVGGHLYPGKPAAKGTGPTIHLRVAGELSDAMARVRDGGGEVVSLGPLSRPDPLPSVVRSPSSAARA